MTKKAFLTRRSAIQLAFVAMGYIIAFAMLVWIIKTDVVSVRNANYAEACSLPMVRIYVPPCAERISGASRWRRWEGAVRFHISETEMALWAKKQCWNLTEINDVTRPEPFLVPNSEGEYETVEIKQGLTYSGQSSKANRINCDFDRERGIGFIRMR